jgi:SAM-dependent methyltransferase
VRHGYFPDALASDERFDAIVFNDVLEHIPDLTGALAASAHHLAPGGVLCLNCPDQRGFFFRTADVLDRLGLSGPYDRLWQRGLPSPHVWYFTPAHLDRATAAAGLEPAGQERLATLELGGLWSRIRMERNAPLALSAASYAFSLAVYPLQALLPGDATACFYRKPA